MTELEPLNNRTEESNYSLRDTFEMIRANWMWFILSILICLGAASLYLRKTPNVYERTASLLIKDSRRGNVTSSAFSDLQSVKMIPNVENEMMLLGSKRLMMEVARNLRLNVAYGRQGHIRNYDF